MVMSRRALCRGLLSLVLARSLLQRALAADALGGPGSDPVQDWLAALCANARDLRVHALSPEQWQERIEALYRRVSLEEIAQAIDVDRLLAHVDYANDRPAIQEVTLPAIAGLVDSCPFEHKVYAMQRDAAVVPHGHNNMVSCHLVLRGTFHVRTFNRVRDEPGCLVLRPSIDAAYRPGQVLTMSSARDNVHWLVATSPHAATFDTPLKNLWPTTPRSIPEDLRIYIDPTAAPASNGLISAPVISKQDAFARFGRVN